MSNKQALGYKYLSTSSIPEGNFGKTSSGVSIND